MVVYICDDYCFNNALVDIKNIKQGYCVTIEKFSVFIPFKIHE